MNNINVERLYELGKDAKEIKQIIKVEENKLKKVEDEAKKLLPRGYWYACDIDRNWHRPKKYSIRNVSFSDSGSILIEVKEVFKKKPWEGFTGKHLFYLDEFLKLKIYKTEEVAMNRPCPKCQKPMMNSHQEWCYNCMKQRRIDADIFYENHKFYDPKQKRKFSVHYEDELMWPAHKGYGGQHFTIRRLDTGEIINTTNLWSDGYYESNVDNLPEIEFLEGNA